LLIDKPAGITSHDVVARVRRVVRTRSVGHTGTLDPFATGLLVLLTDRATRLARFIEQKPKTYLATARLGFTTTTDDRTGEPEGAARETRTVTAGQVTSALLEMMGPQLQVPPAYSAKKIGGERSYRLARRGEAVQLAPAQVTVHAIALVELALPLVTFRTTVSAGTYVRTMARSLGERLDTGAHLEALRREAIGALRVEDAIPLADLAEHSARVPLTDVLSHLARVELSSDERTDVSHGRAVNRSAGTGGFVQLIYHGELVAVAREDGDWLKPAVVLEGK
jgi:tRNA pseudouridine55 synthase